MTLYLIRHAEPDYENDTLTQNGITQAKKLTLWFKDIKLDQLFYSDSNRNKLTASFIEKECNLCSSKVEWADSNRNGKKPLSPWKIKDKIIKETGTVPDGDDWKNIPEFKNDNVIQNIEKHIRQFDDFLLSAGFKHENKLFKVIKNDDRNIAVVCHGGAIAVIVSHLLSISFFQLITHVEFLPASVTKIELSGPQNSYTAAKLIYLNQNII